MDSAINQKPLIDPRPISQTEQALAKPGQNETSKTSIDTSVDRTQRRSHAEQIARPSQVGAGDTIKATEETKALDVFSSLFNSGKKVFRFACLLGGFISATGAVIFTFALNIKSLGVICGIPALLFFYTATTLGSSIKQDPDSIIDKNPIGNLKKITENHPEYLREAPEFVLKTIKAIANMRKNTPLYSRALDGLASLEEAIKMEQIQLAGLDDERSLMHQEHMMNYLRAIENIFEEEGAVVPSSTILANLHRNDKPLTHTQVA